MLRFAVDIRVVLVVLMLKHNWIRGHPPFGDWGPIVEVLLRLKD